MAASFQLQQEGFDHQIKMPEVVGPDKLLTDEEKLELFKDKAPELYKRMSSNYPNAIEFKSVEQLDPLSPHPADPYRHVWLKSKEKVDINLAMQHQLLAYASDYNLLLTAALPHRGKVERNQLFFASLDHAIWFHRAFKIDDWLLFALDSPSASNARGFSRGNIFNNDGELIASVVQEGLIRLKSHKSK